MKKILTASLVAMMAVSAANADIASTNYVTKSIDALNGDTAAEGTASGSYVVSVSQSKGVVKPTVVKFVDDSNSIVDKEKNAPSASAVFNFVEGKLGALTSGTGSLGDRVDVLEKTLSDEGGLLDQVDTLDKEKQDELGTSNVLTEGNTGVITAITATDGVVTATKAQIGTADIADNAGIKKGQLESSVQTSLTKADNAVVANTLISGGTATKITYDAKGLVTGGEALDESDIPTLSASKITNLGTITAEAMGTTATTVVSAINEVAGEAAKAQETADKKFTTAQGDANKNKAVITDGSGNVKTGQIAEGMIANDAVTSAKIASKTIVNDDISDGAAIAQSKISGLTDSLDAKLNKTALTGATKAGTGETNTTPDGTYTLTMKVSNGNQTYIWEKIGR